MIFDNDPKKIGQKVGEYEIFDTATLAEKLKQNKIKIAMLTVPATAAQEIADQLVKAGIKAILNYAPISLNVPTWRARPIYRPRNPLAANDLLSRLMIIRNSKGVALLAHAFLISV